ncbi:polyphosphate kinase [Jannaschia pagri]|uniref:Polyphosphate kinase n=1 Tax=Jannaschia pagri TaxID=2829797 RepID=A0ABQ4NHE5_9RHOB|nr:MULTISPECIES: VOC family protein [unclassified Jannaschia]GIT90387.1 polyphosphate kinase [Jannaschia sp. AI_61]GIT93507.1 polyphosphate kinase [Jannaschia sp. AI_62]
METFDHLVISADTLAEGCAHVEAQTGHTMGPGGTHARMSTHNRLSGLGPAEYMEVIAIDPDAPAPDCTRWYDLDARQGQPRLSNWVLRTTDLDGLVRRFPGAGHILSFARGAYRWRMAVPEDGNLPFDGIFPAFIQWDVGPPDFEDAGLRLTKLTLCHPEADHLASTLAELTSDARIEILPGKRSITAQLETPHGIRSLR